MKNNKLAYETLEKQDDLIQSLDVSDIKTDLIGKSLFRAKPVGNNSDEYIESDFAIQNLTTDELKQLSGQEKLNISMQDKIIQTGLNENTILLIETNKYRATLAELIRYCKGLNISYRQFLPELFVSDKI